MPESLRLLRHAATIYDRPELPLATAAESSYDFSTGAEWMRLALEVLRNKSLPDITSKFQLAGLLKYAAATAAAIVPAALAVMTRRWWIFSLVVPAFYAVEVQLVFLFPLMLDRHPRPMRQSLHLTRRAGGTLYAMTTVVPLATFMLSGGFLGRGFRRSWCVGCLAVCIWYEDVRRGLPHIRCETFSEFRLREPITLLYASDLHLGLPWTTKAACELIRAVRHARPDLLLLGGDIIESPRGLATLRPLLKSIAKRCPIYITPGNHDVKSSDLESLVRSLNLHWLADRPAIFRTPRGECLTIAGQSLSDLPRSSILCMHDPASAHACAAPLAFAGHLHGGQCVIASRHGKLFPGYWFNRLTILRRFDSRSALFISRGLADTLPLRFNCPREVILCRIS